MIGTGATDFSGKKPLPFISIPKACSSALVIPYGTEVRDKSSLSISDPLALYPPSFPVGPLGLLLGYGFIGTITFAVMVRFNFPP